jgi:hypothetical protein
MFIHLASVNRSARLQHGALSGYEQMRSTAANMLDKQPHTADKGWFRRLKIRRWAKKNP